MGGPKLGIQRLPPWLSRSFASSDTRPPLIGMRESSGSGLTLLRRTTDPGGPKNVGIPHDHTREKSLAVSFVRQCFSSKAGQGLSVGSGQPARRWHLSGCLRTNDEYVKTRRDKASGGDLGGPIGAVPSA